MKRIGILLCCIVLCLLFPEKVHAEEIVSEKEPVDIIFVIDCSGSMKTNDVSRMGLSMVQAFVDTVQAEDIRIGYVAYNDSILSYSAPKSIALAEEREGVYVGAAYEAAGIVAAWQCPEYLKQRFRNTSMEYPGVRFDVEANDNALLATTSMTKEISGFTNTIKNAINRTGFGFVFSSDNAQYKGRNVKNITVYKARNLLSNGNEFEPIYKTLVVTYIERMLRFYSGDFKQDKILTFFSNNPNSQKSRWDADRQYVNSILQDGDELDFSIDEKNGVCDVLVTFANTTKNLKVQLTRKAGNE